ncbi:hypothetical protein EMPS_09039 [Entomortierella parvispora]|uniref:Rho-GAP domain-containing protein n=1 Tax=Entomortierella parvispora TaxID=205924 RepID=A0A9P3HH84_9FUNG|nr:hypothetical protein EMPS_09039 [Entomortierella parvispora]
MTDTAPQEQGSPTLDDFLPSSTSTAKALPRPLSIRHSQSYTPGYGQDYSPGYDPTLHSPTSPTSPTSPSTRQETNTDHQRRNLATSRSSNSLHYMATMTSSPPVTSCNSNMPPSVHFQADPSTHHNNRPQPLTTLRSSPFSNPFKKLQSSFGNTGSSKKSLDLQSPPNSAHTTGSNTTSNSRSTEKSISSSSSTSSLTSWKSKGAEMLSKTSWGRIRKNSEPLLGNSNLTSTSPGGPIFGTNLEDAVRISHIADTPLVPAVLYRCAEFLEAKGVDEVGLYRVPGSHANVQRLKRVFDSGRDFDLLAADGIDPNDIATLLKLYLRELPAPLLPPAMLEQFQSLLSTDRHICHTLRGILIRLPHTNYVVLSFLCHHLSKIASRSEKTKMTVSNLGVVFAPTLSIGSVLFRALLGGFYDPVETNENREKGLKIVWGGLLQEVGYGTQDWPEDEDENTENQGDAGEKVEYHEYQQQQLLQHHQQQLRHQQSMPALSPFSDRYANNATYFGTAGSRGGVGPLDQVEQPTSQNPFSSDQSGDPTSTNENAEAEESRLMNAMLLKEESSHGDRTPNSSNSSVVDLTGPSFQTSTALPSHSQFTTMSASATSSRNSSSSSNVSGQELLVSQQPSPPPHVSIETGTGSASQESQPISPSKASTEEAPRLPPIDGLSIAL